KPWVKSPDNIQETAENTVNLALINLCGLANIGVQYALSPNGRGDIGRIVAGYIASMAPYDLAYTALYGNRSLANAITAPSEKFIVSAVHGIRSALGHKAPEPSPFDHYLADLVTQSILPAPAAIAANFAIQRTVLAASNALAERGAEK